MNCYAIDVVQCVALSLLLLYVSTPCLASPRSRTMRGSRGRYCDGPVLRQSGARSALRCAAECSSDARCVSYSHLPAPVATAPAVKCLLHDHFCRPADLLPTPGAVYAEVKWEKVGDTLYYMPTLQSPLNKTAADAVCWAMGGHVLAPQTAQENEAVAQLLYESSYRPARGSGGATHTWIDLLYGDTWGHDWSIAGFTSWASGEPSIPPGGETCATIAAGGEWADTYCSNGFAFLCEKN